MVEHQNHPKKMENLNIIIEINEEGEMADFDISLRSELPYKNTDEYEYVVEEFEKVKEVNHKKLRCLLARELNCFACSAIYRFQLVFVRRRQKVPANNVQYVVVNQRKQSIQQPSAAVHHQPQTAPITKTVRVIPKVAPNASSTPVTVARKQPPPMLHKTISVDQSSRIQELKGREIRTLKLGPNKSIALAQNTARGRLPQTLPHRRPQLQQHTTTDVVSSEEDIETEVIDSSMVEVQIESSSSPKPIKRLKVEAPHQQQQSEPIARTGNEDPSLRCDLCNKDFHSARQRQRHRLTHVEENNIMNCKKCDKAFLSKVELVAHERLHLKGPRKSESSKRKSEEGEVIMEMTVEEEVIDEPDGMYVQEV